VSVCRCCGGANGGPNTHVYSADADECDALKKVAALSYEGQTFAVSMPMRAKTAAQMLPGALRDCRVKSKPLYRLYNNASAPGKDYVSNHRYVTERADVIAAVAQGWVDEGHAMCVPE
jgi:serine protease